MAGHRTIGVAAVVVAIAASACTSSTGGSEDPLTTSLPPTTTATTTSAPIGDEMDPSTSTTTPPEPLPLASTPSQGEGPYYPVEELEDQDSDLTVVAGLGGRAAGNVLLLTGELLTTAGTPIAGGVIDIWQTDANGIYLHPADPEVADRDPFFQGSGEAVTDAGGAWAFRTIDPGYYEPRPRHIHVKVWVDGMVVLTTQIYFTDDPQAAGLDGLLVTTIDEGTDDDGNPVLIAHHRFVLPTG